MSAGMRPALSVTELVQLLSGNLSAQALAERHGVTVELVEREAAAFADGLDARGRPRRAPSVVGVVAAITVVVGVSFAARTAWAQACTQTLPSPMVTFCPDGPALATEVNGNFQQLVTWVEQKVGTVGSATLTTGAINATSLTATGAVSASSASLGTATVTTLTLGGDSLTRFRTLAAQTATATAGVGVGVWDVSDEKSLGSANRTVCFLQQQTHGVWATTFDDGASYTCRVFVDTASNTWRLRANVTRGHHQETSVSITCVASCLSWGT